MWVVHGEVADGKGLVADAQLTGVLHPSWLSSYLFGRRFQTTSARAAHIPVSCFAGATNADIVSRTLGKWPGQSVATGSNVGLPSILDVDKRWIGPEQGDAEPARIASPMSFSMPIRFRIAREKRSVLLHLRARKNCAWRRVNGVKSCDSGRNSRRATASRQPGSAVLQSLKCSPPDAGCRTAKATG